MYVCNICIYIFIVCLTLRVSHFSTQISGSSERACHKTVPPVSARPPFRCHNWSVSFTVPAAALLIFPTSCKPELSNFLTRGLGFWFEAVLQFWISLPEFNAEKTVAGKERLRLLHFMRHLQERRSCKKRKQGHTYSCCCVSAGQIHQKAILSLQGGPFSIHLGAQSSLTNWVVFLLTLYKTTRLPQFTTLPRLLSQMIAKFCLRRLTSSQPKHFLRAKASRMIK